MTLIYFLTFIILLPCVHLEAVKDDYSESLLIKPLPDGMIYNHFQFKTVLHQDIEYLHLENHFDRFPLAIGNFISKNLIKELTFSLGRGHWKLNTWGYPLRYQPNGAELWVTLQNFNPNPWKSWKDITSTLSGLFCASLNFIDKAATTKPRFSLKPDGIFINDSYRPDNVFYASLAHEAVCTENLTPWKKLLPCFSKAGLASLLNAVQIFNSNYFALSLDVKSICRDSSCNETSTEITQSVSVVFNPPAMFEGKHRWSIVKFFGTSLKEECKLASSSKIYVETTVNDTDNSYNLSPLPETSIESDFQGEKRRFAVYDVKKMIQHNRNNNVNKFNIYSMYQKEYIYKKVNPPYITAHRYITGYGVYLGGITCRITNSLTKAQNVTYLDVIPWYLRIYMHTLSITSNNVEIKPRKLYHKPAKDRAQPHHIEIILELPPLSDTIITYDFERAFLKWTEFPPDANHGVYVGAATLTFQPTNYQNLTIHPEHTESPDPPTIKIKTENLLVSLPTPDFSMPYNVICLVSTVITLAFGPIHNLTTKRARIANQSKEGSNFKDRIFKFFKRS